MVLKNAGRDFSLSSTGLSPSMVVLSRNLRLGSGFFTLWQLLSAASCVLQPHDGTGLKTVRPSRFGLFPFRSPLLRESHSISFPQGTKMFQFPWFPLACASAWGLPMPVTRLGNPRLGLLGNSPRLIAALLRPSSATDAKASALCPFLFNLQQPEYRKDAK